MEPFIVSNFVIFLVCIGLGVGVAVRAQRINRKFDQLVRRFEDEDRNIGSQFNDHRRDVDELRRDVDKRLEDENRVFSALLGELNERVDELTGERSDRQTADVGCSSNCTCKSKKS